MSQGASLAYVGLVSLLETQGCGETVKHLISQKGYEINNANSVKAKVAKITPKPCKTSTQILTHIKLIKIMGLGATN